MAEFVAMPLWTDAYLGDTSHLSTIEHGAYLLLLITAWRSRDGMLPDDDSILRKYARLNTQQWARMRPVLEPFFSIENGHWAQGRLLDERAAVKRLSQRQINRVKARWLKTKETPIPRYAPGNTGSIPPLTHNPIVTDVTTPVVPKGDFTAWWILYPHKVGKEAARKAYAKAVRLTSAESLAQGVQNYIRTKPPDRAWCNPATWLNQGRWEDQPQEIKENYNETNKPNHLTKSQRLDEAGRRALASFGVTGEGDANPDTDPPML